jgi:signal transduction histidine kinase
MSLRIRLVLLIVALVALLTIAVAVVHLNSLGSAILGAAVERGDFASQQVKTFIIDHINQHSEEYETPAGLEETKALWNEIVSTDREISNMMLKMVALTTALVEINVATTNGQILASSDPSRVGGSLRRFQKYETWEQRSFYYRLRDLLTSRPEFEIAIPLGNPPDRATIFTIQVVASSVLLRDKLLTEARPMALVSAGALLLSIVLTVLATNRVLRPVKRIEQTIDRIAQGNYGTAASVKTAKEFQMVETKLNLLGEQFRGAQQGASELRHNLDQLLEQMASQIDIGARLAAISRISGNVAHEIKNPLNAIALHLDLLRARLGAPEEELQAEIDVISKEVMRLDRVVKTFLDFSRPLEVRFAEINLAALAGEVADLMAPQARLAQIALTFAPSRNGASPPPFIRGDADLIKQAILNLVTNAIEAMKTGGQVTLSVEPAPHGRIALQIADNGPGIPAELRDKVFQLYFTTKTRGSGIGLAMVYRAIQLHNGTISFESGNGQGTTFRLEFPASVRHA